MTDEHGKFDMHFMQLVYSLHGAAMQQMGKVMNPATGKIERDLTMANNTIEMLTMIEAKTKGNLSEEETKMIGHFLYELRLNFVDETKKDGEEQKKPEQKNETDPVPEEKPEKEE